MYRQEGRVVDLVVERSFHLSSTVGCKETMTMIVTEQEQITVKGKNKNKDGGVRRHSVAVHNS